MNGGRLLLIVAAIAAGVLLWRHIRARELQHDAYECEMLGGDVTDCMRQRGWGEREAVDVLVDYWNRRTP
jgi:hypothetical protein